MAEGWSRPINAIQSHYFSAERTVFLCNKWLVAGALIEDGSLREPNAEPCAICKDRLAKREEKHGFATV